MLNYKITDTNAFPKRITNYTYIENYTYIGNYTSIENYTYIGKSLEFQQSLENRKIEERKISASSYCQIKSCDTIICTSIPREANIETVVSTYIENDFKVLREINNKYF